MTKPKIAILNVPSWIGRLKQLLPQAEITPVKSIEVFVNDRTGRFDAMFTGWERAAAWSLIHPRFAPVIPDPGLGGLPLAYAIPKHEEDLQAFVNTWIDGRRASGLLQQKLDYWVRGKGATEAAEARWSIATNVFGWWKN